MWSSWVKEKGTTEVLYIAKLRDGPKRVKKIFSMILERFLKWYDGGGENGITSKRVFDVEVFFSSQNIDFRIYLKRLLELFIFMLRLLRTWGFDDIWGENHFFKNFFSDCFNMLVVDVYFGMDLCMLTWLNHDYRDGGVVDILAMDVYSREEVCMLIFLGEASN
jgi:hypothetical protein